MLQIRTRMLRGVRAPTACACAVQHPRPTPSHPPSPSQPAEHPAPVACACASRPHARSRAPSCVCMHTSVGARLRRAASQVGGVARACLVTRLRAGCRAARRCARARAPRALLPISARAVNRRAALPGFGWALKSTPDGRKPNRPIKKIGSRAGAIGTVPDNV